MKENIKALFVKTGRDSFEALRWALEKESIGIAMASNCAEAALAIWSNSPPHLVFTEAQLADGNWADVLTLAAKASAPVNVIVVSPFTDIELYLQVIERGGFDFIVPPLSEPELLHVIRIAAENAIRKRNKHATMLPPRVLNRLSAKPA